ncbi:MAG: histone-like protein [Candidatus Micrarchaeia archaeon]
MLLLGDGLGERAYSLYDVEKFIREAGAEKVTEDAVQNLEKELERLTEVLTERAKLCAEHAGRKKIIKKSDVVLAKPSVRFYKRPSTFIKKASSTNASSMLER